ncbi:type II toxin-antitoxin system VapC family toxin [Glycomyces buryatensis]|uniref:Ribonuclease VapC n=1 Tax=Glycomyces buryatensis TaxID=2570927 RepID=A0A4S8QE48_9ACTN|nr:type II toxin-antitoxin system VapC family toxin [Glycomyces buryatensis]THV42610.1 type II toxin-antitoxin system VapC family toxin [Glycomyces buryatensis]
MTAADYFVVDTSAVVAILSDEPGADWLADTLAQATAAVMPAATYLELGMVLESRFGPPGTGAAARFVRDAEIEIVDVTVSAAERALEGWRRFGKGRHRAKLDFGDCIVYGVAAELDRPILCVGEDFVHTNIAVLRPSPENA